MLQFMRSHARSPTGEHSVSISLHTNSIENSLKRDFCGFIMYDVEIGVIIYKKVCNDVLSNNTKVHKR